MKVHTLHLGDFQPSQKIVQLDSVEAGHARVLRVREGHTIQWVSFTGYHGSGIFHGKSIEITKQEQQIETKKIFIGVPDRNAQKECVEHAIACGFGNIIFVRTDRSDEHRVNTDKLYTNAASAQKQSGFVGPVKIEEMEFSEIQANDIVLLDPSGSNPLSLPKSEMSNRAPFVGPPGGLSDEEINSFHLRIKLPSPIMRTEVAVVAAATVFQLLNSDKSC